MDFEQPDSSRDEDRNNIDENDDIETDQRKWQSSPRITHPIPYAIPLTRRNVTRIPVAQSIRWDQQDPPAAEPEKQIPLPKIASPMCVIGSFVVTLLAWSLTAVVTFGYGYVLWNSVLFLFGEGTFYDLVQNNQTVIVVN